MKSQFVSMVLTAGLTMLGSLTLSAQTNKENAKIPFAFQANHNSFPAGTYSVERLNDSGVFQLSPIEGGHSIFVNLPVMSETKKYDQGHLTFACYGDDCVLSQIWMDGYKVGNIRPTASVEGDLHRKIGMASMISVRLGH